MCPIVMSNSSYYVIIVAHDTIRGATHDHRTHGHIDEGVSQLYYIVLVVSGLRYAILADCKGC
jgi:hypothetical protein